MRTYFRAAVQFLKSAHELIVIALFYLAIGGVQFVRPELDVTYEIADLTPPVNISSVLDKHNAEEFSPLKTAAANLITSEKLMRVEIRNLTVDDVKDFSLVIWGVDNVGDVAVWSNSKLVRQSGASLGTTKLANDGTLTFPNLRDVQGDTEITLLIWGNIRPPLIGESVAVTASGRRTRISERGRAEGVRLFVARNTPILMFITVLYLIVVALGRTRRKESTNAVAAQAPGRDS